MSRVLHIAEGLSLPLELVTESFSILAKKRVGKSFTARKIAEQLFKAGLQVVLADPKGDWWGIRSAADGKSPGLSILILGGERGDVPLEVGSGELVAKLVVEERVSVLLDLSLFSKGQVAVFMSDFCETFYRLKALEKNRTPVMFLVDEADAIAPQTPGPQELRMLGAVSDIVRKGGQRGIGCGLVTQRAALLNKSVLTQTQLLILLRTTSPQDRDAVKEWVKAHGTKEQFDQLSESLASLPKGDAWFWSPGWPTDDGIFQRAHVLPIETFDSGKTPDIGEKRIEPKERADVDVEVLRKQMAATIERAKESDPKALRQRIAELQAQLHHSGGQWESVAKEAQAEVERLKARAAPAPKVEFREKPVLKDSQVTRLEALAARNEKTAETNAKAARDYQLAAAEVSAAVVAGLHPSVGAPTNQPAVKAVNSSAVYRPPPVNRPAVAPRAPAGDREATGGLSEYALSLVRTLASREPMALTKSQLALLAGKSPTSGGYFAALAELNRAGALSKDGKKFRLTDAGRALVGAAAPIAATPEALRANWRQSLPDYERALFDVLVETYPQPLSKAELAEKAGKSPTSGGYFAALATLNRNELMVKVHGGFRASETLFE